jgi:hypothetical protein
MAQVRKFNVLFGEWGSEEPRVVQSDQEIWRARRFVMALFKVEADKCQGRGDESLAEFFYNAAATLRDTEIGGIVFGWVKRWRGPDGKERFVGIVEPGADYREAGKMPVPDPATRVPTKVPPLYPSTLPRQTPRAPLPSALRVRERAPHSMTEAERIADRMARASSDAVKES